MIKITTKISVDYCNLNVLYIEGQFRFNWNIQRLFDCLCISNDGKIKQILRPKYNGKFVWVMI